MRSVLKYCVIDVETTGLSPRRGDRICELAAIKCRGDEIVSVYHSLVNPGRPISPGASAVNKITDSMLTGAPRFADLARSLLDFIGGSPLVAHNARFDLSFILTELGYLGLHMEPRPVLDTMLLALKNFWFRSYSLGEMARNLGIAPEREHRALGDAETTKRVFCRLVAELARRGPCGLQELVLRQGGPLYIPEWRTLPGSRFRFGSR